MEMHLVQLFVSGERTKLLQRVTFIKSDDLHSVAGASKNQGETWRKDLEMAYGKGGSL